MERKQRAATLSGVFLLFVFASLILVNVLGYMTNARVDMTKNERFTLSQGSARLVREGLSENMTIKLYVTRGLPKVDLFVNDLIYLMEEYRDASQGKVTLEVIEPKTEEEKKKVRELKDEQGQPMLQELALGEGSETGDQATIAQGFMGIVFEYGAQGDSIPALMPGQSDQGLEFQITNKIREIRDKAEDSYPRVGIIQKDGLKLTDANLLAGGGRGGPSMQQVISQYFPFYKFSDVDLEEGEAAIDPELDGVIVMQASKDWTDKELARIDEFLMRGDKALLVVAGAVNMQAANATALCPQQTCKAATPVTLSTHGIEKLTSAYGINIEKNVIFDLTNQMRLQVQTRAGAPQWITVPGLLQIQHDDDAEDEEQPLDQSFAGFFRLDQLAFPYASSLQLMPEKQPSATLKVVARSSEDSYVKTGEQADLSLKSLETEKPSSEQGSRPIAAFVEGKLVSALKASDQIKAEGIEVPAESAAPSRVLVIGSPLFFANPFAHAGNPPPMPPQMAMMGPMGGDPVLQQIAEGYRNHMMIAVLAFKNLLDWLTGDQDLLAVSAKLLGEPNLSYSDVAEPEIKPEDTPETVQKKLDEYRQGRKSLQNRIQWTVTLFPPLVFILFGVIRWQRRESRRSQVKV